MSAEKLREAAALMRSRAEGVWDYHAGEWRTQPGPAGWAVVRSTSEIAPDEFGPGGTADTFVFQMDTSSTAEHIASWHPAVALAVADWLAMASEVWCDENVCMSSVGPDEPCGQCSNCDHRWLQQRALATAHAYLGSDR